MKKYKVSWNMHFEVFVEGKDEIDAIDKATDKAIKYDFEGELRDDYGVEKITEAEYEELRW